MGLQHPLQRFQRAAAAAPLLVGRAQWGYVGGHPVAQAPCRLPRLAVQAVRVRSGDHACGTVDPGEGGGDPSVAADGQVPPGSRSSRPSNVAAKGSSSACVRCRRCIGLPRAYRWERGRSSGGTPSCWSSATWRRMCGHGMRPAGTGTFQLNRVLYDPCCRCKHRAVVSFELKARRGA